MIFSCKIIFLSLDNYSCKRKVNMWLMALFCNIMDISAYNAFLIYSEIKPTFNQRKKYKRQIFLEELGESLVKEKIIRRKMVHEEIEQSN